MGGGPGSPKLSSQGHRNAGLSAAHRWDHDKRPEALLRVLVALAEHDVPFRVALAGANTRSDPWEFDAAIEALGERVVHVGHLPRDAYEALLLRSDVVVSTAAHEFFGVATVEAVAAGLAPVPGVTAAASVSTAFSPGSFRRSTMLS